ncbi:cytochrome c3 family protein, partial [Undibacterium sp. Ji22W]|uniref:cytochrome c3 family protein n=1 Tax=Undibacterium sp. Ji22W TaxID=3413038 RepID=UPI003BF3278B
MKCRSTIHGFVRDTLWKNIVYGMAFVLFFLCISNSFAQTTQQVKVEFNHKLSGFFLEGAHGKTACESCHVQGLFRGTPRDCASCHRSGDRASGKPSNHIPTAAACDTCHANSSWSPSIFRHRADQGVVQGSCASCHNGSFSPGKPLTHISTTASCDSCHKTNAWQPASYSHAGVTPGSCASCHNGVKAAGKSVSHIPTTASCDACHSSSVPFAPISVTVTAMHAAMSGPPAAGNCASCHGGGFVSQNAQAKPATHISTSAQCDACHSSKSSWATSVKPDHLAITPSVFGRCADCHNSVAALGKPGNHIPTNKQCDSCHSNFSGFKPAQMNHQGTTAQCSSCHNGSFNFANAQAKSNTHIPTTAQCDSCHTTGFVTWSPSTMNHANTNGKCSTCHSGSFIAQNAQAKPAKHITTTAQCDSCHTSTTTWTGVNFNHANVSPPVAGRCASCHNGSTAAGKSATHIPTTAQCDSCHTSGFSTWTSPKMNHAGMAGTCSTCHSGAYVAQNALTKPATHISTTAQCDSCHTSTTTWTGVNFNHANVSPPVA